MKLTEKYIYGSLCFLGAILVVFFIGCAAEGMPSGGPKDETGPVVISTFPSNGDLNVEQDVDIVFQFSEAVAYKTVENSLTVFPAMEKSPKVKVSKDVVKIRLADKLKPNTTYIFSFGRKVQDLQSNMTDGEVKIAFSTGDQLDNASISGRLYDFKESEDPAYILLYKNENKELDSLYRQTPDYFTSVDKFGNYHATNLSRGLYTMLAFVGNFKGAPRITEKSQTAVGFQNFVEIKSEKDTINDIDFRLGNYPLLNFEYLKAIRENDNLDLTFSHSINVEKLTDFQVKIDEQDVTQNCYFTTDKPEVVHLAMANFDSSEYVVEVEGLLDQYDREMSSAKDTVLWKKNEVVDTTGSTINMDFPSANGADINSNIKLSFSEPVVHAKNYTHRISFFDEDSAKLDFNTKIISVKELELVPDAELKYATKYNVKVLVDSISDFYGNVSMDSVRSFSFTTVDNNQFGLLSGTINSELPLKKLIVGCRIKDAKELTAWTEVNENGFYQFEQLMPGEYQLSIFYDKNENKKYDWGRLAPYCASEKYKFYAKPVIVRSRWETERVDLTF